MNESINVGKKEDKHRCIIKDLNELIVVVNQLEGLYYLITGTPQPEDDSSELGEDVSIVGFLNSTSDILISIADRINNCISGIHQGLF